MPGASGQPAALSVQDVTRLVSNAIIDKVPKGLWVRGEVSNFAHVRASGHAYFTLKDASSCLSCVMFADSFEQVKFEVGNGMDLLAHGDIRVFTAQGKYQLYIDRLEPIGAGALELAFKQLQAKLAQQGFFEPARKKPLPRYPSRLILITSRQTAALQDMLKVLRRFPWISLRLFHVPVQGDNCGRQIAAAVNLVNRDIQKLGGADAILLGRGGGSLEDLWGFNDESLARAIFASAIPVITGVGHEVDTTIADLVADYHAHTPTEAAQVITSHWRSVGDVLFAAQSRLRSQLATLLQISRHRFNSIEQNDFFRRPTRRIEEMQMRLDHQQRAMQLAVAGLLRRWNERLTALSARLDRHAPATLLARWTARLQQTQTALAAAASLALRSFNSRLNAAGTSLAAHHPRNAMKLATARLTTTDQRLKRAGESVLQRQSQAISALAAQLDALSPQRILERGYTVTLAKKTAQVIRSAADVHPHDVLVTRFADGQIESIAVDPKQRMLFDP